MKNFTSAFYIVFVIVFLGLIVFILTKNEVENYKKPKNITTGYYQMSHLPFAMPPTGRGSLGYLQKKELQHKYPPLEFSIGEIPISCPPDGIRIYETGNAQDPNVYSEFDKVREVLF